MANKFDAVLGEYREDDASVISPSAVYLLLDQNTPQQILNDGMIGQAVQIMNGTYALQAYGEGYFADPGGNRIVSLSGGTYAIEATGTSYFHTAPYEAILANGSTNYAGYFTDDVQEVYLADGVYAINATGHSYFHDGSKEVSLANSSYVISATGGQSYFSDSTSSLYIGGSYSIYCSGQPAYFSGGSTSVTLNDGIYALNATGWLKVTGGGQFDGGQGVYVFNTNTSPYDTSRLFEVGGYSGFTDGYDYVNMVDGYYVIQAITSGGATMQLYDGAFELLYVNLECNGQGTFGYGGSLMASLADSSNSRAGYFTEGTNTVSICDNTYAVNAYGKSYFVDSNYNTVTLTDTSYAISTAGIGYFAGIGNNFVTTLVGSYGAGDFTDGTNITRICDGTNSIDASGTIHTYTNFSCNGLQGYTGDLNDSTSTKIADVYGGIITAVYY